MKITLINLFVGCVASEITTSFWFPPNPVLGDLGTNTEKITYLASVIGADRDRMTLAFHFKDELGLGLVTDDVETFTFASTLLEYSNSDMLGRQRVGHTTESTRGWALSERCEIQTAGKAAICTESVGPEIIALQRCSSSRSSRPALTVTSEWTFSDHGTQGVQTIVHTFLVSPTTPIPDWCSGVSSGQWQIPSSELIASVEVPQSKLTTFAFIITAGEEKLIATTGGAVTTSTAAVTGSTISSGSQSQLPSGSQSSTGAAAPIKTMVPALAGLGVAVAAFF